MAIAERPDILASLVGEVLWELKGEVDHIEEQQPGAGEHGGIALPLRQQDAVHGHEDGREEHPDPEAGRGMEKEEEVDNGPHGVGPLEEAEAPAAAREATGGAAHAGQRRDVDQAHQGGDHEA